MDGVFMTYQSVPTIVKAVQFLDRYKDRIYQQMSGNIVADHEKELPILKVTTIHGETAIVRLLDWIVEDSMPGTYYPIKDEVFRKKYRQL
jgi:hypothetical protein